MSAMLWSSAKPLCHMNDCPGGPLHPMPPKGHEEPPQGGPGGPGGPPPGGLGRHREPLPGKPEGPGRPLSGNPGGPGEPGGPLSGKPRALTWVTRGSSSREDRETTKVSW